MLSFGSLVLCLALLPPAAGIRADELALPPRSDNAPPATALKNELDHLGLSSREERLFQEVISGNVPDFYRKLVLVTMHFGSITGTVWVACEYLVIGSNEDFMLMPGSPMLAQRLANKLDCTLPTPRMVDAIHVAAEVRLTLVPIPPSPKMTTLPVFCEHQKIVWEQRRNLLDRHPLGALTSGHKKDVVLSARLERSPYKVAVYGWHTPEGSAIQPLNTGHTERWVDHSHGIRLVQNRMLVNGRETTVAEVLKDPTLAPLLSNEGPLTIIRYPTHTPEAGSRAATAQLAPAR